MKLILKFIFLIIIITACRQSTEPEDDFKLPDVPDSAEVTFNEKGWAEITSFPNNVIYENIRLVEAANEKIAWVSDWDINIIYKTHNGGESWEKIEPPIKGNMFYIEALDSLTLWIGTQVGEILKSTDGGYNWVLQHDSYFINYIEFFDSQNGIAMGDSPLSNETPIEIIHTSDGGSSWINKNSQLYGFTTNMAVSFSDPNNGYMRITESSSILRKTTNGGESWSEIRPPIGGQNIFTVIALTPNVAVISQSLPSITTDGGVTWTQQNLPTYASRFSKVRNNQNYLFTIAGTVHRSVNSGRDWKSLDTGISTLWQSISTPKENVIWLTGKFGKVTYKVL